MLISGGHNDIWVYHLMTVHDRHLHVKVSQPLRTISYKSHVVLFVFD